MPPTKKSRSSSARNRESVVVEGLVREIEDPRVKTVSPSRQEASFEDFQVLFDGKVSSNVKQLEEKFNRLSSGEEKFSEMQGKMFALLDQGETKTLKMPDKETTTTVWNMIRKCPKSFDESHTKLMVYKTKAADLGITLCHLIVDLVMFVEDDLSMDRNLRFFERVIKWVAQGEPSVVIQRVLNVLTMMHKRKGKEKGSDVIAAEEEGGSKKTKKKTKKKKKKKGKSVNFQDRTSIATEEDSLALEGTDHLFIELLRLTFVLETFWTCSIYPKSLDEPLPFVEANLYLSQKFLEPIELQGSDFLALYQDVADVMKLTGDYKAMLSKVDQEWQSIKSDKVVVHV